MKDDSGSYAVFTEQRSSASQMTAAKIMDIISRLPGCDGQAVDGVSAETQVKMEDAHKLLKIPKIGVSRHLDSSLPRHKWPKSWSSMEDPVVPLERNLYGHPLAGLSWERQFEKILMKNNRIRAKTKKTSQETKKSLQKFLEQSHKPKVIYSDNSMEFGRACEDLSWNHRTSTARRSETSGIAERAVRPVKEGTSAVLLQSGLDEKWWADSMECHCHVRKVQGLLADGKHLTKIDSENHLEDQ